MLDSPHRSYHTVYTSGRSLRAQRVRRRENSAFALVSLCYFKLCIIFLFFKFVLSVNGSTLSGENTYYNKTHFLAHFLERIATANNYEYNARTPFVREELFKVSFGSRCPKINFSVDKWQSTIK